MWHLKMSKLSLEVLYRKYRNDTFTSRASKKKLSSYLCTYREKQSDSLTDSSPQDIHKSEINQYVMVAKPDPESDPQEQWKLNSHFS